MVARLDELKTFACFDAMLNHIILTLNCHWKGNFIYLKFTFNVLEGTVCAYHCNKISPLIWCIINIMLTRMEIIQHVSNLIYRNVDQV